MGISPQMVSKNANKGKIKKLKNGKYNTEDRLNKFYIKERQEAIAVSELINKTPNTKDVKKSGKISIPTTNVGNPNESSVLSKLKEREYKLEKIKWTAMNERLKAEEKQGLLVEVELVQEIFNKIGMIVNNDLLQRGQRDSNLICGLLGVSDPDKILEIKSMLEASDIRTIQSIKQATKSFSRELKKRIKQQREQSEGI